MLLRQFPNLQWLKAQAEKGFHEARLPDGRVVPVQGWPTVVLNVQTREVLRDNIKGPLSLFVNLSGESHATAGKHRARVDSSTYFLSNNEQYYTLEVDADAPVELFNIHFGQEFAPQVAAAFTKGTSAALESPETNGQATHFYNQLYPRTAEFNQLVKGLANHPNINSNALLREEYLGNIMALLLKEHQQLQQHIEQLPAVRVAVREEVYQRLARAVDYMHSHYEADLSLDELAAVACLSKFHFLRLFRAAYNLTPSRYLQALRLEKARVLLRTTQLAVSEVSLATGFGHPNAFIRAFGKAHGCSPGQFRAQVA